MSARMTAVDAQFYWMSAKVPSDDFVLYAFEGEPTDFERAVDEEVNLDEVVDRILPIYMAMKGKRIQPKWTSIR
jgi:hypothetical protein